MPIYLEGPFDILTTITAFVAAKSLLSLFNLRQTCRVLKKVADEPTVLRRVKIESFSLWKWHRSAGAARYINLCIAWGNKDAKLMDAIICFVGSAHTEGKQSDALVAVEKLAQQGHIGAMYFFGTVLLCSYSKTQRDGIEMIRKCLRVSEPTMELRKWRRRFSEAINSTWSRNPLRLPDGSIFESIDVNHVKRFSGWPVTELEEDFLGCELCEVRYHAMELCKM